MPSRQPPQAIENQTAIDKVKADKEVVITNAEAEAEKTRIAAEAQADANQKIAVTRSKNGMGSCLQ